MARRLFNNPADYDGNLFENADGSARLWWVQPKVWRESILVGWVERAVEDEAIRNLYYQSRALRYLHYHRYSLSSTEQRAVELERRCMKENPHLHGNLRYAWIAEKMGHEYSARQIQGILEEATDILADAERSRIHEILHKYLTERIARKDRPIVQLPKEQFRLLVSEALIEDKLLKVA